MNIKTGKKENHSESFMEWAKQIENPDADIFAKGFKNRLKEMIEQGR